jgi:hypothetical protein
LNHVMMLRIPEKGDHLFFSLTRAVTLRARRNSRETFKS